MPFDHMSYSNSSQFTDPWGSSSGPSSHSLYVPTPSLSSNSALNTLPKQQAPRLNNNGLSMPPYSGVSIAAISAGTTHMGNGYGQGEMLTLPQDLLNSQRIQNGPNGFGNDISYASAPASTQSVYARSTPFDSMGYTAAPTRSTYTLQPHQSLDISRRLSQQSMSAEPSRNFGDAIDASQGMIAMSQNTTPRNIYGPGARTGRESGDSYGFPSTHSTSSSVSSTSNYPSYFSASIDSSVSDYSGGGSDMESVSSRTLPRPSGLGGNAPPPPQSMMTQFSSKVSSSAQKKHKCKVCDKRFTRPSSLQTHIYSHTGEKPFSCEVEGCGRHFSVVSNLRRHRKVHKDDARSDAGSDHSDD